jgi:acetoin utilization protein AcuB
MLVRDWMSKNVIVVGLHDSVAKAIELMKEHHIHTLPVVNGDKLMGIVTDKDIERASLSTDSSSKHHGAGFLHTGGRVKDFMVKKPIAIHDDQTLEEVAEVFVTDAISSAPVIDNKNKLVGIITKTDLFKAMIKFLGGGGESVLIALQVLDWRGRIKEITDIIRAYGGRMRTVISSYDNAPEGYRNVYIRASYVEHHKLPKLIEELHQKAAIRYIIDQYTNERQIFMD